jgi:hypothetical protein
MTTAPPTEAVHFALAQILVRGLAIGTGPAVAGGILLRWFAPASRGRRAR